MGAQRGQPWPRGRERSGLFKGGWEDPGPGGEASGAGGEAVQPEGSA